MQQPPLLPMLTQDGYITDALHKSCMEECSYGGSCRQQDQANCSLSGETRLVVHATHGGLLLDYCCYLRAFSTL